MTAVEGQCLSFSAVIVYMQEMEEKLLQTWSVLKNKEIHSDELKANLGYILIMLSSIIHCEILSQNTL